MINESALDLKVARRKAGLTQLDSAHLLGVSNSRISMLETGKRQPTANEICMLSLIYGRSFESLFSCIFDEAKNDLQERIVTMPEQRENWLGNLNRQNSLNALSLRLEALDTESHDR